MARTKKWQTNTQGILDKFDYERLRTTLNNTKLQVADAPLYQLLEQMISGAQTFKNQLLQTFNKETDKIDLTSQVNKVLPIANGGSFSLYYYPILSNGVNVAATTPFYCQYFQVGRVVYVSGKASVDPTAGGVLTIFGISLPIPSKFTTNEQCNGTAVGSVAAGMAPGQITGNVPASKADVSFFAVDGNIHDVRFIFTYELF